MFSGAHKWFRKLALYTATYRFDDPFLPGAAVLPGLTEQLDILRKNEGPRKKAKLLFAKATLHLWQISPQSVFPADLKSSWEVVQLGQEKWVGCSQFHTLSSIKTKAEKQHIFTLVPSGALQVLWNQETSCDVPSSQASHGSLHGWQKIRVSFYLEVKTTSGQTATQANALTYSWWP